MKGDQHEGLKHIRANTSIRDTDDWEVVLIGTYAAGLGIAAGGFTFGFRSLELKQYGIWIFAGVGLGAGIAGGWDVGPTVSRAECSTVGWFPLKKFIKNPFSSSNLCNATGHVSNAVAATPGPVGAGLGSALYIEANYKDEKTGVSGNLFDAEIFTLFDLTPGSGGLASIVIWGKWLLRETVPPAVRTGQWTMPVCSPKKLDHKSR